MKFNLIDRVTELVPGQRVKAVKSVTLAEEYLADHFPTFPVLPGVLMIEAMVQASMCLVRATEGFAHSILVMAEARNVTYKSFVAPGRILEVQVEAKKIEADASQFVGVGRCGDQEMVKAHWTLRHMNLADEDPTLADLDAKLVEAARRQMNLLGVGV
jgi:3-hydroxyacyl-[acyl-carrier-protein] dehydratase